MLTPNGPLYFWEPQLQFASVLLAFDDGCQIPACAVELIVIEARAWAGDKTWPQEAVAAAA